MAGMASAASAILNPWSARKNIIHTCGACHVGIRKGYLEGVHGKDYVKGSQGRACLHGLSQRAQHPVPGRPELSVYATKVAGDLLPMP